MKKLIYILVTIFFISACEKEIDIDIPDRERKIVVNSTFTTDQTLTVNLSKTLSIIDRAAVVFLDDASIKLYQEGEFIEDLEFINNGNYISSNNLSASTNYTIEVTRNGNVATATNHIPTPIEILSLDTSRVTFFGEKYFELEVEFKDNGQEDNFYMFTLDNFKSEVYEYIDEFGNTISDTSYYSDSYFESDDIIIENWLYLEGKEYIMFTDNLISGNTYKLTVRFYLDSYGFDYDFVGNLDQMMIIAHLFSVSEAYYQYFKTYSMHRNAIENAFAEPVQVYSNVENGLGVFAGFSLDSDSIAVFSQPFVNN